MLPMLHSMLPVLHGMQLVSLPLEQTKQNTCLGLPTQLLSQCCCSSGMWRSCKTSRRKKRRRTLPALQARRQLPDLAGGLSHLTTFYRVTLCLHACSKRRTFLLAPRGHTSQSAHWACCLWLLEQARHVNPNRLHRELSCMQPSM